MTEYITDLQGQVLMVFLVISLIFYLLQTLFGYKLFKVSCAIIGFFIGLILGIYISGHFFGLTGAWPPIIGVLAGFVIGFLAFRLFLVGLFVLAFIIAFELALLIPFPENNNAWDIAALIIAVAIAIFAGVMAVKFQKTVIIVITAVGGAFNAVRVFNQLTNVLSTSQLYTLIASAALAAVGLLVQFLSNRE